MKTSEMVIFNVKVPADLKEAFLKACENQDSSGAREVRKFMRDYLKKNGQKELDV